MTTGGTRASNSTESNLSDHFYSARSSTEDADMLGTPAVQCSISPSTTGIPIDAFHDLLHSDNTSWPPTSPDYEFIDAAHAGRSLDTSSLTTPDPHLNARQQLMAKGWIFPPDIPISVVKYAVARRELAMQTQVDPCFDLVETDLYTHPPVHTAQTEKLRAWHKIVTRSPMCLSSRHDELQWPHVKLAFGPLDWDQVWAYEFVDLKKLMHNAGQKDWWIRRSQDHLNWCIMHHHIEIYGVQVRFPYGHDAKVLPSDPTATERLIRIPADEQVLVPLGKDISEWASQVSFQYQHWDNGPPFPRPFNPYDRAQEPPTITLRFRNKHPEASTSTNSATDKGHWIKGWLTIEELTMLSADPNTKYLDTVIDRGPKFDPTRSDRANRAAKVQFWGLDGMKDEVTEWLAGLNWLRERFRVAGNDSRAVEVLTQLVGERVYESVARAVRGIPL